jgi:tetratricopeptide (TPR) repeat protein
LGGHLLLLCTVWAKSEPAPNMRLRGIKSFIVLNLLLVISARADDRVTVAILPPQNLSGDTNETHWKYSVPIFIEDEIEEVKSVRPLPDSSIEFAYHTLKLKWGEALTPEQARQLGEVIEAGWVVWGAYEKESDKWRLKMQMMNVKNGKVSKLPTASSTNWFEMDSAIAGAVLHELGVTPTRDEEERMKHPPTSSAEAFELLSRFYELGSGHSAEPISVIEADLRRVVDLDPNCVRAQSGLAHFLLIESRLDEAAEMGNRAIKTRPDDATAHFDLGTVYLVEHLLSFARAEFVKTLRLRPDDAESYVLLAEILLSQGESKEALSDLKKAESLAPYDALTHVELAIAYLSLDEKDTALAELKVAEQCDLGTDINLYQTLGKMYAELNEIPKAVEYAEKYAAGAKAFSLPSATIQAADETVATLKASLSPHFVSVSPPQVFTPDELESALKSKLSIEEYQSVTNPITSTPEMKKWAEQLAGDSSDDEEKAKRLYYGLPHHLGLTEAAGRRTAEEAFRDRANLGAPFTCQEYSLLYVALARDVGLKAYFVTVETDYKKRNIPPHACAGVCIGGKALLVDPAYQWFGVPHEKYEFQNDFQMMGIYLAQLEDMAKGKAAARIAPDSAYVEFFLAGTLSRFGELKGARQALDAGLKLSPDSCLALCAQGDVEEDEGHWDDAASHLQQCVILVPDFAQAHFMLARALTGQKKFKEARDEYRTYLGLQTDPQDAASATAALTQIEDYLSKKQEHQE